MCLLEFNHFDQANWFQVSQVKLFVALYILSISNRLHQCTTSDYRPCHQINAMESQYRTVLNHGVKFFLAKDKHSKTKEFWIDIGIEFTESSALGGIFLQNIWKLSSCIFLNGFQQDKMSPCEPVTSRGITIQSRYDQYIPKRIVFI